MSSIAQVSEVMERVLKGMAKSIERETGFVQRSTAQLDGPVFAQMATWTWLDTPDASYSQLQQVAASLGVVVSAQAIAQRFGKGQSRSCSGSYTKRSAKFSAVRPRCRSC